MIRKAICIASSVPASLARGILVLALAVVYTGHDATSATQYGLIILRTTTQ